MNLEGLEQLIGISEIDGSGKTSTAPEAIHWGTIVDDGTSDSQLAVHLDGEGEGTLVFPSDSLTYARNGDRVQLRIRDKKAVVMGTANNQPVADLDGRVVDVENELEEVSEAFAQDMAQVQEDLAEEATYREQAVSSLQQAIATKVTLEQARDAASAMDAQVRSDLTAAIETARQAAVTTATANAVAQAGQNATTAINAAKQDVLSDLGDVADALDSLSAVTTTSIEELYGMVNAGQNFIRNTYDMDGWLASSQNVTFTQATSGEMVASWPASGAGRLDSAPRVPYGDLKGKTVTLSVWLYCGATTPTYVRVGVMGAPDDQSAYTAYQSLNVVSDFVPNTWVRVSKTFTLTGGVWDSLADDARLWAYVNVNSSGRNEFSVKLLKLETGSTMTAWTPHPLDDADSFAAMRQQIAGVEQKADANTSAVAALTGTTIPDVRSAITANASSISAAQSALATLNNTTIPAMQNAATATAQAVSNAQSAISTLNTATIPAMQTATATAQTTADNALARKLGQRNMVWNSRWNDGLAHWEANGTAAQSEVVEDATGKNWLHATSLGASDAQGRIQSTWRAGGQGGKNKVQAEPGESYTLQALVYGTGTVRLGIGFAAQSGSGTTSSSTDIQCEATPRIVSYTRTCPANKAGFYVWLGATGGEAGEEVWVTDVMLSKGTEPVDWTPAPEDADEAFVDTADTLGQHAATMQAHEATMAAHAQTMSQNAAAIGTLNNTTLPALRSDLSDLSDDMAGLESDLSELDGAVAVAQTTADNAATAADNVGVQLAQKEAALSGRIAANAQALALHDAALEEHDSLIQQNAEAVGALNDTTLPALRSDLAGLSDDLSDLNDDLADVGTAVAAAQATASSAATAASDVGTQLAQKEAALAERITANAQGVENALTGDVSIARLTSANDAVFRDGVMDTLAANEILANSMMARSIVVEPSEYAPNPALWPGLWTLNSRADIENGVFVLSDNTTSNSQAYTKRRDVKPGMKFAWSCEVRKSDENVAGRFTLTMRRHNGETYADTNVVDGRGADFSTEWQTYSGVYTVPNGAANQLQVLVIRRTSSPASEGWYEVRNVSVKPQVGVVRIEDGAVTADKIVANAVTAAKIAADAVTANKIKAGAVVAGKIAAGAVTAIEIAGHTITANEIASGTITATELHSGAVTAEKIAANAVTASAIDAGAVTADKIEAGAVTSTAIEAGAITAGHLAAGAITTSVIAADAAGFNAAVVNTLVSSDAYVSKVLSSQVLVEPTDYAPNPLIEPGWWELTRASLNGETFVLSDNTTSLSRVRGKPVAFKPDDVIAWSFEVRKSDENVAGPFGLSFQWDGAAHWVYSAPARDYSTEWETYSGFYTMPETDVTDYLMQAVLYRRTASPATEGFYEVRNLVVRKAVGNVLIQDGAITADKIQAGAITAGKIQSGAVTASMIAADSAGFNDALIRNLVSNQTFTQEMLASQVVVEPVDFAPSPSVAREWWTFGDRTVWDAGSRAFGLGDAIGATLSVEGRSRAVSAGDTLSFSFEAARVSGTPVGKLQLAFGWNASGGMGEWQVVTELNSSDVPASTAAEWRNVTVEGVQVPAGKATLCVALRSVNTGSSASGGWYVRNLTVRKQVPSVLIQDGAVSAGKIAAGAVTADTLAAGAVTAGAIDAGVGTFKAAVIEGLVASDVFARALRTERLMVEPTDLMPEPEKVPGFWTFSHDDTSVRKGSSADAHVHFGYYYRLYAIDSVPREVIGTMSPLTPGAEYAWQIQLGAASSGLTRTMRLVVDEYSLTGTTVTLLRTVELMAREATAQGDYHPERAGLVTGVYEPSAATGYARVRVVLDGGDDSGGYRSFSNCFMRPKTGTVMIQNGAVTADLIATGAVVADKIEAGAIHGTHIAANTISSDKLLVGADDSGNGTGIYADGVRVIDHGHGISLTATNGLIAGSDPDNGATANLWLKPNGEAVFRGTVSAATITGSTVNGTTITGSTITGSTVSSVDGQHSLTLQGAFLKGESVQSGYSYSSLQHPTYLVMSNESPNAASWRRAEVSANDSFPRLLLEAGTGPVDGHADSNRTAYAHIFSERMEVGKGDKRFQVTPDALSFWTVPSSGGVIQRGVSLTPASATQGYDTHYLSFTGGSSGTSIDWTPTDSGKKPRRIRLDDGGVKLMTADANGHYRTTLTVGPDSILAEHAGARLRMDGGGAITLKAGNGSSATAVMLQVTANGISVTNKYGQTTVIA